jgi:hypothetical protein
MAADTGPDRAGWITMAAAMVALREAGKLPEESVRLIFDGLVDGSLLGRADSMDTEYSDGTHDHRVDQYVDTGIWGLVARPPLGHLFWLKGDVRVGPLWHDAGTISIGGRVINLPLGGLLPAFTIRGLRLSDDAVLALCRSFERQPKIGRRKGAGGYAKDDEPLVAEMREQILSGTSLHAAAVAVAGRANGVSQFTSKVKRLMTHYRATFPDSPLN